MKTTLAKWSSRLGRYRIFTNAFALMMSVGGSGILGILYWYFATHLATQKMIGRAAAEIAAITLLSTLSQLSFGSVFQRYLPGAAGKAKGFVLTAYSICFGLALAIAAAYTALGFTNRYFVPSLKWSVLFTFTVALYTIFGLQDYVLVSLRVSRWVAVENNLFGVAKIILVVPLAAYATGQGIILSWTIPTIGTVIAVNWYIFRRRLPKYLRESTLDEPLPTLKRILGLAIPQYTTTLLNIFSTSVVTLIVIARLGATENAYYFLAAQIAGPPVLLLWNVSRLLIVEAAHEAHDLRRLARHAVAAMSVVVVISMGFGITFAHQILGVFGASYANHGTTLLRLLLLALPGAAVAAIYYALAWIDNRLWYLMIRQAVTMVVYLSIILAFIGREGINAVGYAAVITSGVEFLLFLPITIRRIRAIPPTVIKPVST
jgi:O-antigen/teichoic acid export membrane protein